MKLSLTFRALVLVPVILAMNSIGGSMLWPAHSASVSTQLPPPDHNLAGLRDVAPPPPGQETLTKSTATSRIPETQDQIRLLQLEEEMKRLQMERAHLLAKQDQNSKNPEHTDSAVAQEFQTIASIDDPNTFAGCLQIMDDNHFLIEWLAYHYHVMPLRRLVVLMDPHSKTTPQPILDRWKGRMNITLWHDEDVFPNFTSPLYTWSKNSKKNGHYVHRQKTFYSKCIKSLKREGRGWLLLTDTDEYTMINDKARDPHRTGIREANFSLPSQKEPGSVMKLLQQNRAKDPVSGNKIGDFPCITMPRRTFSTKEMSNATASVHGYKTVNLQTLHWTYYSKGWVYGKVLLDLQRIQYTDIRGKSSIHRPANGKCLGKLILNEYQSIFAVNHYPGTLEQMLFRDGDARGSTENATAYRIERFNGLKEIGKLKDSHGIQQWFPGFLDTVGVKEARDLLENVGQPYEAAAFLDPKDIIAWTPTRPIPANAFSSDLDSKRTPSHPPSSDSSNKVLPHTDFSEAPRDQGTSSTCRIPKLVHFVYLSPHLPLEQPPVPDKVMRTVERWREVNQGWEVRLWNNTMVREHFPDLVNLMSNVTTMAWVANMARYHIIQQFGGMYVDTDFVPFQPMDGLCQLGNFIVCQSPHLRPELSPDTGLVMDRKNCSTAINAVMGFEANHPAVNKMLNVSLKNTRNALARDSNPKYSLQYTGPPVWTRATKQDMSVAVLHPYTFLPCHWIRRKQYCVESKFRNDTRVYAMHEWDKSWG